MDKICIVVISIGFFLNASHLLVQSLPIKYNERNSNYKIPRSLGDILKGSYNSRQDSQERLKSVDEGTDGFVMFPKSFEGGNKKLHPVWRKNRLNLYPNVTQHSEPGYRSTGDYSPNNGKAQTEMTISVAEMKTDKLGNYLFEKWGFDLKGTSKNAYSKEYLRGRAELALKREEKFERYTFKYIFTPNNDRDVTTVCASKSTIYNTPNERKYLLPRIYDRVYPIRAVWMDLREQIWKDGNSQECHKPDMLDWYKYINCAIKRNMRMEYLIPKYPLHQKGYYFFFTVFGRNKIPVFNN